MPIDANNARSLARWVLAIGVVLRVALALVNSEANDVHMNVIKVMADEHRIPAPHEDREAFQPKLYHGTVAAILRILPRHSAWFPILIAQLLSCTAGLLTLWLAYRFFLSELEVSEKVRLISFSMLALNPVLIGINAQATNDSFVILFGSLTFYFGWHFFRNSRTSDFCWMLISAVLAGLSKGNGVVFFIAILAVFAISIFRSQHSFPRSAAVPYGLIFLVGYLALVPALGPYWQFYRVYGSPFVTNADPGASPSLPEKKSKGTSIADALFTFRFLDLLKNPYRANRWHGDSSERYALFNRGPFPVHQSSAWSQLYGRAHFVHFDAWPPSWAVPTGEGAFSSWARPFVFNVGRLIFLSALFPTLLMLIGSLRSLVSAGQSLVIGSESPEYRLNDWLVNFTTVGYVLFLIALLLKHPEDVGWFKSIYIFPGFLAFLVLFARECDRFYVSQNKFLRLSADTNVGFLLFLYVIDVTMLAGQLGIGVASHLYDIRV